MLPELVAAASIGPSVELPPAASLLPESSFIAALPALPDPRPPIPAALQGDFEITDALKEWLNASGVDEKTGSPDTMFDLLANPFPTLDSLFPL
jgi:hypothetical protein